MDRINRYIAMMWFPHGTSLSDITVIEQLGVGEIIWMEQEYP